MSGSGYRPVVSPYAVGLKCRCPRCGKGRLFQGFLTLRKACEACGLDFSKADSGDGPAVFMIFILGFTVVPLIVFVEFIYEPPVWVTITPAVSSSRTRTSTKATSVFSPFSPPR